MTCSSESSRSIPRQRALVPRVPDRMPAVRRASLLPAIARWRVLPAVTKTAGAVALGLALEYALRGVANGALARVGAATTLRPAAPSAVPSIRRTIVTEVVVIERYRRRG